MGTIFRFSDGLSEQLEYEFSQSAVTERFEAANFDVRNREGFCMTSALYWVKKHSKLANAGGNAGQVMRKKRMGILKKQANEKAAKLIGIHDRANARIEVLAQPEQALARLGREITSRAADINRKVAIARGLRDQAAVDNTVKAQREDLIATIGQKRGALDAKLRERDEVLNPFIAVGATTIASPYRAVASRMGLALIDGWRGEGASPNAGATVVSKMQRGGYYILSLNPPDGDGHAVAAAVAPQALWDADLFGAASLSWTPAWELQLFDPNLGAFTCKFGRRTVHEERRRGGRPDQLIQSLFDGYQESDTGRATFSGEWRLYRVVRGAG